MNDDCLKGVECPNCGQKELFDNPSRFSDDDDSIDCRNCKSIFDEENIKPLATKTKSMKTETEKVKAIDLTQWVPKVATTNRNDPEKNSYLIVAPPGWGKTELISSFPEALFLACEAGHKFVSAVKIIIDCWDYPKEKKEPWIDDDQNTHMSFMQAVDLIVDPRMRGKFKFVAIDTVDSLIKLCLDYHYALHKVEHANELGDYGVGWNKTQNDPIRRAFNSILSTGRGMAFTTHEQIDEFNGTKGKKSKKVTTLPGGIFKLLNGQCDYVLHGVLGGARDGNTFNDRIIVTEHSEDILAKNRGGMLPPAFIVDHDISKRWGQFKAFFDPKTGKDAVKKATDFYKKNYE
jgi:hypothetical protein